MRYMQILLPSGDRRVAAPFADEYEQRAWARMMQELLHRLQYFEGCDTEGIAVLYPSPNDNVSGSWAYKPWPISDIEEWIKSSMG